MLKTEFDAVIMRTTNSGYNPDVFYTIITVGLADQIDQEDPWGYLEALIDLNDRLVLNVRTTSKEEAINWCESNGYLPDPDIFNVSVY